MNDSTKRAPGGPAERMEWLTANASAVNAGAFRLLVIIANHAKRNGMAYPSWERLMALTGVSHSSIDRQLAELKAAGLITITHNGKGSRTVNHYQLSGAVDGWVSSPADGTTEDVTSPVGGTTVVPPTGHGLSRPRDESSPADGTGNPGLNKVKNPTPAHSGAGVVLNPDESTNQTAHGLTPGGLVDSSEGEGDEDDEWWDAMQAEKAAKAVNEAAAKAVKLAEAAAAKAAADLAEWESIPPCADCGRERWTDDLDKHRKAVKRGATPDVLVCLDCR